MILISCGMCLLFLVPGFPHLQPRVRQWRYCWAHGQVQLCLWRRNPVWPTNTDLQLSWGCFPLWGVTCSLWSCGVWKDSWRLLKTVKWKQERALESVLGNLNEILTMSLGVLSDECEHCEYEERKEVSVNEHEQTNFPLPRILWIVAF